MAALWGSSKQGRTPFRYDTIELTRLPLPVTSLHNKVPWISKNRSLNLHQSLEGKNATFCIYWLKWVRFFGLPVHILGRDVIFMLRKWNGKH